MQKNIKNQNIKKNGEVFTPNFLVEIILDSINYNNSNILKKHIIDNSCGQGAFLCKIVKRYFIAAKQNNLTNYQIEKDLSNYIHAIEINPHYYKICIEKLNTLSVSLGLNVKNIIWDILQADSLLIDKFDGKMDFVVANPPYVRVHNLIKENKQNYERLKIRFNFLEQGMADLYLAFYQKGFEMLKANNKESKLVYITPNSWLTSLSGLNLRKYIVERKNLVSLIDLGHLQPFAPITTYSLIGIFNSSINDKFTYFQLNNLYSLNKIDNLTIDKISINNNFYLGTNKELEKLKKFLECKTKLVEVKNGFATLNDKVFIKNQLKDFNFFQYLILAIKASTGKAYVAFFPYLNGKAISKEKLFENKEIAKYLIENKNTLLKNTNNFNWYLYGRNQAIKDVYENKIAISSIIKNIDDLKLTYAPQKVGVFGGLYIKAKKNYALNFNLIEKILKSNEFFQYVQNLRKYKKGGFYTFNSKDLEKFLNYKLSNLEF